MKANAPEKLYLIQHNGLVCYCRNNEDDIEYTRTDAFIEKACEYLEPILTEYAGFYVGGDILQHFKNYMKGE